MTREVDNNVIYLHLDSSIDDDNLFPDNNLGDFTVLLPDVLNLKCDEQSEHWEVALEAVTLPNCLMNILKGHNKVEYSVIIRDYLPWDPSQLTKDLTYGQVTNIKEKKKEFTIVCPFFLPTGYMDVNSFVNSINNHLKVFQHAVWLDFKDKSKFVQKYEKELIMDVCYDPSQRKLFFHHNRGLNEHLYFPSKKLRKLIGLSHKSVPQQANFNNFQHLISDMILEGNSPFTYASETCNFNRHFQNLIVHCDIVEESVINDKYASILRILDVSSLMAKAIHHYPASSSLQVRTTVGFDTQAIKTIQNKDELLNKFLLDRTVMDKIHSSYPLLPSLGPVFQRLHFIPLNSNSLQKISFKLANEFGEDIYFVETRDVTRVVLCFRRVKNNVS